MFTNLLLNLLLINRYASIGVAISTIITEFLIALIEMPIIFSLIEKKETVKNFIKYFILSIIMFIVVYLIGTIKCSILILVLQIIAGICIYGIILLLTGDKLITKILKR